VEEVFLSEAILAAGLQQQYGMQVQGDDLPAHAQIRNRLRLHVDTWIQMPMPPIRHIVTERNVIRYAHPQFYPGGNQDLCGRGMQVPCSVSRAVSRATDYRTRTHGHTGSDDGGLQVMATGNVSRVLLERCVQHLAAFGPAHRGRSCKVERFRAECPLGEEGEGERRRENKSVKVQP
jgi:hypothetical protein